MTTTVTVLRSGQNTTVGSVSSRSEYSISVATGLPGVSVTAANAASGNLVLTLSNNSTIDAGSVSATVNTSVNTSAQYTWSNTHGFTANVTIRGIVANGSLGSSGQVLTSNGTSTYWANSSGVSSADLTANLANYATTAGLSANVATMTANNTSFVGTVSAANVVSNSQLASNLANYATTASLSSYQTTAGLSANVATLSSNNASYLGGIAANQYAYANSLTSYQTTAGLSANVATLTSNNASYLGGVAAASYLVTNTAINTGNVSVTGNITLTGNLTGNTAGFTIGYLDVPQNYTNTSFTIALSDRGKHIYTANGTSQTITIANNSSVAFPVGTAISIVSQGAGTITVARGTGVTLYLAANNTSADRTIASYGMATLLKVNTDTWFINGAGVS